MNKKLYEKTRYQNIWRHIKNKNYVITLNKPVKTSISLNKDGNKIYSIDEAKKIKEDSLIVQQKAMDLVNKESFDVLWDKYLIWCKTVEKQAYNTILRKNKDYNKYLKNKISKKLSRTNSEFWATYIENLECSIKQKNSVIKTLKAFLNWCVKKKYIIANPMNEVKPYKVAKTEMLFWDTNELKQFMKYMSELIENGTKKDKEIAYRIKILSIICCCLGDRIGETRVLRFSDFNATNCDVNILHSINYDPKSKNYFSHTKNNQSQRTIDVSPTLIKELEIYFNYLKYELNYNVQKDSIIFWNYLSKKPFTDTILRNQFHKFCEKANVKKIRLYDLRHTYVATMMSDGKELYQISKRIGHSSISTTVNKYGHLSNNVKKEIAKSTDKYIF